MATTRTRPFDPAALRTAAATALGGAVAGLSRALGRGQGAVVGGRAILAVDPHALQNLSAGRRVALVSGTNGKTTTTHLLAAALGTVGPVITNAEGANLPPGLATVLAGDRTPGALAALEVDEAWLGRVVTATHPRVALLLNLSRDQLDRNNEVRRLASGWRAVFATPPGPGAGHPSAATAPAATAVVANADDPLVAWGAGAAADVTWVGAGLPWKEDASGCPACGGRIHFDTVTETGGAWACTACTFARPAVDLWVEGDEVVSASGQRWAVNLAIPGTCNVANAAMAMAGARRLGAEPAAAFAAMGGIDQVGGRYRTVTVGEVTARLLLAKNPAGWTAVFDQLAPPPGPVVVGINARIADGRDPSWLWDVPFERLAGRRVVATGERGRDLAVRLHYAEVEHVRTDDMVAAIAQAGPGPVDVVGNYTSFQTLARRLGARR